jgi:hypothetical protein
MGVSEEVCGRADDLERGGHKCLSVHLFYMFVALVAACTAVEVEELSMESEDVGVRSTRLQDADATELVTNIYAYHTARNDLTALDPLTRRVYF